MLILVPMSSLRFILSPNWDFIRIISSHLFTLESIFPSTVIPAGNCLQSFKNLSSLTQRGTRRRECITHYYLDTLTGFPHQVTMATRPGGLIENGQRQMLSLLTDWLPNQKRSRSRCVVCYRWNYEFLISWLMRFNEFTTVQCLVLVHCRHMWSNKVQSEGSWGLKGQFICPVSSLNSFISESKIFC